MKALTIQKPWASPIVMGVKDVENRSTHIRHRGRVLVHQGRRIDELAVNNPAVMAMCERTWGGALHTSDDHLGCVIGSVELYDVQPANELDLEWANPHQGWAWLLRAPRVFTKPQWVRGWPGLFEIRADELDIGEALHPADYIKRLQRPDHVPEHMAD